MTTQQVSYRMEIGLVGKNKWGLNFLKVDVNDLIVQESMRNYKTLVELQKDLFYLITGTIPRMTCKHCWNGFKDNRVLSYEYDSLMTYA